ncbi:MULTISPECIES: hypothetical protein [Bacillus]|uniref:Uncharacterized protein n=2 Tax=Bacillus TaxID=1386 RepID=A0ABS3P0B9_9BACI|nr:MULTISPECIES: hypothetical protein [Bacillus]MBO1626633.1 hypothetical protein [Bacillus arachidis]SDY72790.1 hypothetical protein SAMN04488156_10286 [Bacillus sp. 166amftsu]
MDLRVFIILTEKTSSLNEVKVRVVYKEDLNTARDSWQDVKNYTEKLHEDAKVK